MTTALTLPRASTAPAAPPRWLDRTLYPFEHRHVRVGEHRIHYVDEGQGPTLLLVHGSPAWSIQYRRIIAILRSRMRCVALDMPGFGLTEAAPGFRLGLRALGEVIEGFVERLGLERFTLAIHATGGPPGMHMAVRHAERIQGLVIANSFAWPLSHHPSLHRMARIVGSPLFGLAQIHGNLLMRIFAAKGCQVGRFTPAERAAMLGPVDRPRRRQMQQLLASLTREEDELRRLEAQLRRLRDVPALLTFGGRDKGYRAGTMTRWQAHLPYHEAMVVERAGHFIHEDVPDEVAERIGDFVVQVAGSKG